MPIRNYANVAQPTSLTSDVGINDTTLPVVSTAGYPSTPFTIVMEKGEANEEFVLVQGKTGTSFTDCVRGYDGTSQNTHLATTPVEHAVGAIDYREANVHINDTTRDDHTQYFNAARLAAAGYETGVSLPVGTLVPYLGTTAPSAKWLLPAGQPVSRATYAALFALVGTTFGAGDGLSTFNLPDLRGRVPMALDNLGGAQANVVNDIAARTLGGVIGSHTVALSVAQLPAHNHAAGTLSATISGSAHIHGATTNTTGAHTHTRVESEPAGADIPGRISIKNTQGSTISRAGSSAGSHSHSVTVTTAGSEHTHVIGGNTANAGGGAPLTMLQPSMAVGYLLRALA